MKLIIKSTLNKQTNTFSAKNKQKLLIVNRNKIHEDSYFEMSSLLAATVIHYKGDKYALYSNLQYTVLQHKHHNVNIDIRSLINTSGCIMIFHSHILK